jgi:hypothetical protein
MGVDVVWYGGVIAAGYGTGARGNNPGFVNIERMGHQNPFNNVSDHRG